MEQRKSIVVIAFCAVVFLCSSVAAADVAYLYRNDRNIDPVIVDFFSHLNASIDFISQDMITSGDLPANLSSYKLVFIGDEHFRSLPSLTEYPAVVMNYYIGQESGLTDREGVSSLTARDPLQVSLNGTFVKVYTSANDARGKALSYYFLDDGNRAGALHKRAGTYATGSGQDFGDVISFGNAGDTLLGDHVLTRDVCFFGIVRTAYWTPESSALFKDCVAHVAPTIIPGLVGCESNAQCGVSGGSDDLVCSGNDLTRPQVVFTCNNPGTISSFCSNVTTPVIVKSCMGGCIDQACVPSCLGDSACNDNNPRTDDVCVNPGKDNAQCMHTPVLRYASLRNVNATVGARNVTLHFFIDLANSSGIRGISIRQNNGQWNFLSGARNDYTILNLTPATNYTFFVFVSDSLSRNSTVNSISLTTLSSPVIPPTNTSNGSNGNNGGGNGSTNNSSGGNNNTSGNSTSGGGVGNNTSTNSTTGNSTAGNSTNGGNNNGGNGGSGGSGGSGSGGGSGGSGGGSGGSGGGSSSGSHTNVSTTSFVDLNANRGGLSSHCVTEWDCSEWSVCSRGLTHRECTYKEGFCEPEKPKPMETEACVMPSGDEESATNVTPESEGTPKDDGIFGRSPITGSVIGLGARSPWLWIIVFIIAILAIYAYVKSRSVRNAAMAASVVAAGKKKRK